MMALGRNFAALGGKLVGSYRLCEMSEIALLWGPCSWGCREIVSWIVVRLFLEIIAIALLWGLCSWGCREIVSKNGGVREIGAPTCMSRALAHGPS